MLKITISLKKLTFKQLKVDNNKVNKFGVGGGKEIARKSKKSKSQKSAKSKKNY